MRGEVGADHEGSLDHAHEDVGGCGHAERAADAHGPLEQEGERLDHQGQDAPVVEHGGHGGHDQDDGQGAEGEDEARAGIGLGKGQVAAAEVAEDKGGSGHGGFFDDQGDLVEAEKKPFEERQP